MLAAAWSSDGSLLAAAAGDAATLWEPSSNALLATLPTPLPAVGAPLRHLAFVPVTPFLVPASYSHIPSAPLQDCQPSAPPFPAGFTSSLCCSSPVQLCMAAVSELCGVHGWPKQTSHFTYRSPVMHMKRSAAY